MGESRRADLRTKQSGQEKQYLNGFAVMIGQVLYPLQGA